MSGERTEKPTAQRRRQVRRDGRLSRSTEIGTWAAMLAATWLLPVSLRSAAARAGDLLVRVPEVVRSPEPGLALRLLREAVLAGALAAAPLCLALMAVGMAAAVAQGGLHPSLKLLAPKFSRLNPVPGIKRMAGPHALWELVKALVKTATLGAVLYSSVRGLVPALIGSGSLPLGELLGLAGAAVAQLARTAALAGLVMAGVDFAVVYRRNAKALRMTKHEVKEENRRSEGDPHVKSAIRSRQLATARRRMMSDVPKADVVVVNPTHVATALRYDPARGAPRVVAKGAGVVATKIREVATAHRIPLVQDVPLARALYAGCEVGAEIPPDLYAAVARVLAFVLGLKARGSAAGLHRPFAGAAR